MIEGLLIGAAVYAVGVLTGRFLPSRRRTPKPKRSGPICGCGHHLSYHDDYQGCHHPVGIIRDPCPCRKYSGPDPLPEYYAPEIPS